LSLRWHRFGLVWLWFGIGLALVCHGFAPIGQLIERRLDAGWASLGLMGVD